MGGRGELASVHAIAEETRRRPKTKIKTETNCQLTKTEQADAEQATHRQEEEESRWAVDATAASAVQGQVSELARMVKGLQRQRISIMISMDMQIKVQRTANSRVHRLLTFDTHGRFLSR